MHCEQGRADIHAISSDQNTPFMLFAGAPPFRQQIVYSRTRTKLPLGNKFSGRILLWLDSLHTAGYNLQTYVEKECALHGRKPYWTWELYATSIDSQTELRRNPLFRYERTMFLDRELMADSIILRIKDTRPLQSCRAARPGNTGLAQNDGLTTKELMFFYNAEGRWNSRIRNLASLSCRHGRLNRQL